MSLCSTAQPLHTRFPIVISSCFPKVAIGFIPTHRLADRFGESELMHAFAAEPDAALPQALPADVAELVAAVLPARLRLPAPPDSAWCLRDGAAFVPTRAETLAAREARGVPARTCVKVLHMEGPCCPAGVVGAMRTQLSNARDAEAPPERGRCRHILPGISLNDVLGCAGR